MNGVGAGLFILFIFHHILNWRWWTGIFKGKYTPVRVLQTVINLLTLTAMLGLMISGVLLSNRVFAFLHLSGYFSLARRLHMASSYWGFLLMMAHLGLHWGVLLAKMRKSAGPAKWQTVCGGLIALYGIFAMAKRDLLTYLFLRQEFVFLDFGESKLLFYLDYLAIAGTFIFLFHTGAKLLRSHVKPKKAGAKRQ